jgi:Bacterial hydrolase
MVLTDENSLWGTDVYLEVAKDVPGAGMTAISGTFPCQVFEGPYSENHVVILAQV